MNQTPYSNISITSTSQEKNSNDDNDINYGLIIGLTVGIIIFVALFIAVISYVIKRKRKKNRPRECLPPIEEVWIFHLLIRKIEKFNLF